MNRFSPSDAALEGFRITRENPRAFAWWASASFLLSIVGAVITITMPADVRHALETLGADETLDGKTLLDAFVRASPLFFFGLALQSLMTAAIYRVIFRHSDTRFGYLRFGADELRLMVVTLLFYIRDIVLIAAAVFVTAMIANVAALAGGASAFVFGLAGFFLSFGSAAFVIVRMSLTKPSTFATRRISLRESWRLTKGSFWPLLGSYVLAIICVVLMGILAVILFCAVAGALFIAAGGQLSDLSTTVFHPDERSLATYLHPAMIGYMVVGSIFSALYNAVIASPGAVVYRGLHDHEDGQLHLHGYSG